MYDIDTLWSPKFRINSRSRIVTFGSCFAQHFARALTANGFRWLDCEPSPKSLTTEDRTEFNYGIFSARTGNIYTPSLLLQWLQWAFGEQAEPEESWVSEGRVYDPFRPRIEPDGFASVAEMRASRQMCLEALKTCVTKADVFVFTLGLTESWFNSADGYEYSMCPGTVAGEFNADQHRFVNQDFVETSNALKAALRLIRKQNPKVKVLLTVSPVPLTATNSDNHVLVATTESKAILRAVAGQLARDMRWVDYFPSFEIISSTPFRGSFFEPNMRSVNPAGVAHVMNTFFTELSRTGKTDKSDPPQGSTTIDAEREDVVCEEELLIASRALKE
jgi:hypothetical protein